MTHNQTDNLCIQSKTYYRYESAEQCTCATFRVQFYIHTHNAPRFLSSLHTHIHRWVMTDNQNFGHRFGCICAGAKYSVPIAMENSKTRMRQGMVVSWKWLKRFLNSSNRRDNTMTIPSVIWERLNIDNFTAVACHDYRPSRRGGLTSSSQPSHGRRGVFSRRENKRLSRLTGKQHRASPGHPVLPNCYY